METSTFGFVTWIISFMCLFILYQWIISPAGLTLVWAHIRDLFVPKDSTSKLKHTSAQASPQNSTEHEERVTTATTYDENWFTSPRIFDLEQRAIFSKTWLFAIHRSRFGKPGDYHTLTLATFSIFLILGQDQIIRAFHNVCRHRAYTITKKTSGSSTVLGCRYHGWSYNTRGNLVKAPEFDRLPGFDKKLNGLFEIRTEVTNQGLVFVNFDAVEVLPDFEMERLRFMERWKIENHRWASGWNFDGNFNWKFAGESGDGSEIMDETAYSTSKWHSTFPVFTKRADQKSFDLFPGTEFFLSPSRKTWISVRYIPRTASKTHVQVDLHTSLPVDHQSNTIMESRLKAYFQDRIRQLERRHADLIHDSDLSEENLARQDAVHSLLTAHLTLERVIGREIHPAIRAESVSKAGQRDDDRKLDGYVQMAVKIWLTKMSQCVKSWRRAWLEVSAVFPRRMKRVCSNGEFIPGRGTDEFGIAERLLWYKRICDSSDMPDVEKEI